MCSYKQYVHLVTDVPPFRKIQKYEKKERENSICAHFPSTQPRRQKHHFKELYITLK